MDNGGLEGRLLKVVREAGAIVRGAASSAKVIGDSCALHPTTDLDKEVDNFLYRVLREAFAGPESVGYLSEERGDDLKRLSSDFVLIVDPIDGTRSLLRGLCEATISVALWHKGDLVWGCVHNPFTGETFSAARGKGAWCGRRRIGVSQARVLSSAHFVLSRTEHETGRLTWLESKVRFEPLGSIAYKMALVAQGTYDGTFTPGERHEWDIAAATIILEEALGKVTDKYGRPMRFNKPDPVADGVVATNGHLHSAVLSLLQESPW